MSSINTNVSAMNALSIMRNVNADLATTQERISTGSKVNSAKDNAAYFAISETMKGDSGMYKAIDEGLTMTKNVVSTARLGAETFADLAKEVSERVAFAQGVGVNLADVQSEINALTSRMSTVIEQSTFNGVSLVDNTANVSVVTGVSRDSAGGFSTTSISISGVGLSSILGSAGAFVPGDKSDPDPANHTPPSSLMTIDVTAAADADELAEMLVASEYALSRAVGAATSLGIAEKSIETQQGFLKNLTDGLDKGVGSLVDADMEKEAARLQALQVQQQLATQSLSIANQAPQSIMALFR
jgi:flagellin